MKNLNPFKGICLSLVFFNFAAYGTASLQVSPIRLEIQPEQKSTSLEIINYSEKPLSLHLSAVTWKKPFGKDVLEPTKDVIVSPPIVTLEPQEKQIIRIAVRVPPDAKRGRSYRLIIKEFESKISLPSYVINTLLEIRVPVMVAPLAPSVPKILWTISKLNNKKLKVSLKNAGESYISLHGISLRCTNAEKPFVEDQASYYILPNQKQDYEFESPDSFKGSTVEITADTSQGPISEVVSILQP